MGGGLEGAGRGWWLWGWLGGWVEAIGRERGYADIAYVERKSFCRILESNLTQEWREKALGQRLDPAKGGKTKLLASTPRFGGINSIQTRFTT